MKVKNYTVFFIFFLVIVTASLSAVNYFIDPYMIFQTHRLPGFNYRKPAAANHSAQYKPYNIINIKPETIIVGNSRPEMGIDPNSICWPAKYGTVYSLTFPGKGTYNQSLAIFHSVSTGHVKNILLGIDFRDFLHKKRNKEIVFWPNHKSEFSSSLLVDAEFQENKRFLINKIENYSNALFSLNTLNDSIYTLISQSPSSSDRTNLGFNPAKDYEKISKYEGSWTLFAEKQNKLNKYFLKAGLSIYDSVEWSIELEAIKRVIQLSIDKKIHLTLFINPYHYSYLEAIFNAGYWNEFEIFKKSLTNVIEQYSNKQVVLWDFALYSKYTVTPIPKKGINETNFNWFWEPAHYKSELGELMLAEIFGQNCVKNKTNQVGVKIDNINILNHLYKQKKQRSILLQKLSTRTTFP